MPIVDGKYEAKLATVFVTVGKGFEQIKERIAQSRKVRISNVPVGLVEEIAPRLGGKDVKIILAEGHTASDAVRILGELATSKARIYKDYKGTEANVGSISFSNRVFEITWTENEILEIAAMEYDKCVKCLKAMFEVGWRYARK